MLTLEIRNAFPIKTTLNTTRITTKMADINKKAEEWIEAHPDATKKEIWLAGYWQSTENWCNGTK